MTPLASLLRRRRCRKMLEKMELPARERPDFPVLKHFTVGWPPHRRKTVSEERNNFFSVSFLCQVIGLAKHLEANMMFKEPEGK